MKNKYSVILGNLGNTCDRFLPTGYKDVPSKQQMIRQAASIPGIEGLELVGSWDITEKNVAESAFLLQHHGRKLFHMHFNDNYRSWDDDMIVGSLHVVEYLELLFWLKETDYAGWYSMDQYPYREEGTAAVRESVAFLRSIEELLTPERMAEIRGIIASGDATASTRWMRELLFGSR